MRKHSGSKLPPPSTQVTRVAYSIQETAEALGVGRTLIYRLIDDGKIKSLKIGKRHMVAAKEIEDFLNRMQEVA